MDLPQVQMMGRRGIPDVVRELMNIFSYRYAEAYCRVVRTSYRALVAVHGTSLSEMVFSHLGLTLSEFESLPAHSLDMR